MNHVAETLPIAPAQASTNAFPFSVSPGAPAPDMQLGLKGGLGAYSRSCAKGEGGRVLSRPRQPGEPWTERTKRPLVFDKLPSIPTRARAQRGDGRITLHSYAIMRPPIPTLARKDASIACLQTQLASYCKGVALRRGESRMRA